MDAYTAALSDDLFSQTDDRLYLERCNLLFSQQRDVDAIASYEEAVRTYDDPTNRFSKDVNYDQFMGLSKAF